MATDDSASVLTADSLDTFDSASSATTVWGPGTLSGKVILSLGEASLRGLGHVILRLRLAKISSSLLKISPDKQERMYDDLLELSRLDYYTDSVRHKALRLIMFQIGCRETSALTQCIVKWPKDEIRIFLSELMPCVSLLWRKAEDSQESTSPRARLELVAEYRSAQLPTEQHEVIPFLDFILQLSRMKTNPCRAILEAQFIPLLVEIHEYCDYKSAPQVVNQCVDIMAVFLETAGLDMQRLNSHRMVLVWPRLGQVLPLSPRSRELANYTPRARRKLLATSTPSQVINRLCEIEVLLLTPEYHGKCEKDFFDMCLDLLELCLNHTDHQITNKCFVYLTQCITLEGPVRKALVTVLSVASREDNLDFFYRIVYPLQQIRVVVMTVASTLYQHVKDRHPETDAIEYFILFALEVAERSRVSAEALIEADFVALLSANRRPDLDVAKLLRRLYDARDKLEP